MTKFRILHASDLHMGVEPWRVDSTSAGWYPEVVRKRSRFALPLTVFKRALRAVAGRFGLPVTDLKKAFRAVAGLFRKDLGELIQSWRLVSHDKIVLRAFAIFAHNIRKTIDAMIITGDLATTGNLTDLQAAYEFLTAPAGQRSYLTAVGEPTLSEWMGPPINPNQRQLLDILPGNHDRYRPGLRCLPGGTVFDARFSPALWVSGTRVQAGLAKRKNDVVLHVVKADFALSRWYHGKFFYYLPGWYGQGRVYEEVLEELVEETKRIRKIITDQECTPISLWAIHFDPFTTDETLQLLESERLIEAAKEANVTAILCGHTHESKIKPLSDTTTVYACGTTCQANKTKKQDASKVKDASKILNDCQVLEIEVDTSSLRAQPEIKVGVIWYRYEPPYAPKGRGRFVFLSRR